MPHNVTATSHPIEAKTPAQGAHSGRGVTPLSLIDELEDTVAKSDLRRRAAVMRRVTDLFIMDGVGFLEEHVDMFDDVMSRLVAAMDSSARAEFGDLIAKHPNAPLKTSRILALDDEIKVAAHILSHSTKLDEATLVEGAKTKSQEHLYAISLRQQIAEVVTDVLVERGNKDVVISTASNPGAKLSEFGCSTLATRSRDDIELALRVWLRPDIPRQHLLSLFSTASEEVQKQLEAADRPKVQLYRYMVAQAKAQIQTKMRESSPSYASARPAVEELHRAGELSSERLLEFAQDGKFDEVTIGLSLMCDFPVDHIERAIIHNQADHLLVLAKAIGLSWDATKAILLMRSPRRNTIGVDIDRQSASFTKLQAKTAIAAMQFYRLRARAEAQLGTN
jgi:uncharacterized protein (DUF2336 family)